MVSSMIMRVLHILNDVSNEPYSSFAFVHEMTGSLSMEQREDTVRSEKI